MDLTLYYAPGSRAQRVRWILEELELEYRLEHIDLYGGGGNTDAYRAIHPLGQLPALRVNGEVMIESGAIVQWLAETDPQRRFAPAVDSPLRREFDQWMYFAVTSLEQPAWEIVLHRDILPPEATVADIIPFAEKRLAQVLRVLESIMESRDYLVGDGFTAADIMTCYLLMWFRRSLADYPALRSYVKRLAGRPAYRRSRLDR